MPVVPPAGLSYFSEGLGVGESSEPACFQFSA